MRTNTNNVRHGWTTLAVAGFVMVVGVLALGMQFVSAPSTADLPLASNAPGRITFEQPTQQLVSGDAELTEKMHNWQSTRFGICGK